MKKRLLLSVYVLIILISKASSQVDLENGLLLYHPFKNGSLIDVSGNNRNCELNGATTTTDINGTPNQAYEFDGDDDYMIIQSDEELEGGASPFTFSFQFQIHETRPLQPLIGKYLNASNKDWAIRADGNIFRFTAEIGGGDPTCNQNETLIVEDSIWYCGVVTLSEPNVNLYLNNELVASCSNFSQEIASTNTPVEIGALLYQNAFFKGKLDEIRIYNRVLNTEEIDSLCNQLLVSAEEVRPQSVELHIFPNPADEAISIRAVSKIDEIRVFDALGREYKRIRGVNTSSLENIEIDVSLYKPGLYLFKISTGETMISKKVIIN